MNEDQEKVNFKIENRDTVKGELQLKLQFKYPKKISIETDLDKIQVTFVEDVEVKSSNFIVYIPNTTKV